MQTSNKIENHIWLPQFAALIIVTTLIGICTFGTILLAKVNGETVSIWPADGLLLAILLTAPRPAWPIYILSGYIANAAGAVLAGYSGDMSLKMALANSFEIIGAIALAHYYLGSKFDLSQSLGCWRFALVASIFVSPFVIALSYVLGSFSIEGPPTPPFLAAFLAHVLGIVTVAPLVLTVRRGELSELFHARNIARTLSVFTLLLATVVLVFGQYRFPLLFMVFPPLVLAVTFCGFAGGALSIFAATALSICFTAASNGPMMLIPDVTPLEKVLSIQMFLAVAAIMVLVLSVLLAERDHAEELLRNTKDDLAQLATTDGLTGLANRRRMNEALDQECRRAARDHSSVAFLLLDVDHFKAFNDHYGHQAGDECLCAIASVVKSFGRRPGDVAARYGGEELALILPGTDEAGAMKTAEAIRAAIEALALPHAGNNSCGGVVTASAGIAITGSKDTGYDPASLIRTADDLLYEAKRTGRNQVMSSAARPADPVPPPIHSEESRAEMVETYLYLKAGMRSNELDRIAQLAARILHTPIALVSLVGRDKQVFVGRYGLDVKGTGRDASFCAHVITGDHPMVIPDAREDPRFKDNALVTGGLNLRFYAGAPLITSDEAQVHLGALCVIDREARPALTEHEKQRLNALARLAVNCIEQDLIRPPVVSDGSSPLYDNRDVA
jgi:diguanylate cyclase (GGDEF)-like protein